jgi:hypothetical protein
MKATLHKLIGTAVLGLALASQSLPAWAGHVTPAQVTITSNAASGSMAGARYSADNTQYIGCTFSNTSSPYVLYSATDKNGNSFVCAGIGSQYAAVAKSITDFSYLIFSYTYLNSCSLSVLNQSTFLR